MKYWRGYLTALVFTLLGIGLMLFAKAHTALIDMAYPYVTRMIMGFLAQWSSGLGLCVWQLVLVALAVVVLASVVLMILLRWNPIQWFGWVLAIASVVFLLHTGIYGLNYYAGPLSDDLKLSNGPYTFDELKEATIYYRDKANDLSTQVPRDETGKLNYPSFEALAAQAGDGFHVLTYEKYLSVFAGSTVPVKKLGWADLYTSMGITGVTVGITGEAAVNPQIPAVDLPFTMCHEMSHRMSIAVERDANMAAFLACSANPDTAFQYSGYFMAYLYCYRALAGADSQAAAAVAAGMTSQLRGDLNEYQAFFSSHKDEKATKTADQVNNAYLQMSGDHAGTASYGDVCDLLVNWHIQKIVLPSQQEEQEKFDPLDENQVDLEGRTVDDA